MKKIFSLIFIVCLAFTGMMLVGCDDNDRYLYKVDGIQIESIEIEKDGATGDFVFEIELENTTKANKDFDFTLIKLKVNDSDTKLLEVNFNKQTINARAEKEFLFLIDEESVNINAVEIGTSVSVYYSDVKLATILVQD